MNKLLPVSLWLWNITSLIGKEPELVQQIEGYQPDIVGFTSKDSTDSGTKLLERDWSLSYSGVVQGERQQAGMRIFTSSWLSAAVLEFSQVNKRVVSM